MSLFGDLALRFGSHPENLATEALGDVVKKSAAARRGFVASMGTKGPILSEHLAFETQYSDPELGRPDLAANDDAGNLRLLVEAKLWAGFTEHQPLTGDDCTAYLKKLCEAQGIEIRRSRARAEWTGSAREEGVQQGLAVVDRRGRADCA